MIPYLSIATQEAAKSPMAKQHGAVLVKNGKVISMGHNRYRQRSMTTMKDSSPESEVRLRRRHRRHQRKTHGEGLTYEQFCRMDGRLAASIHAEELAIMRAGPRAHGSTLYVVRYVRDNKLFTDVPAASCPCKRCTKLCEKHKVKVYYTRAADDTQ